MEDVEVIIISYKQNKYHPIEKRQQKSIKQNSKNKPEKGNPNEFRIRESLNTLHKKIRLTATTFENTQQYYRYIKGCHWASFEVFAIFKNSGNRRQLYWGDSELERDNEDKTYIEKFRLDIQENLPGRNIRDMIRVRINKCVG